MKRFVVLAVVLALLVMMVSSVSAHHMPPDVNGIGVANVIIDPPDPDPDAVPSSNHVIIDPPKYPDSVPGDSVSIEEGIATPILFGSGAENVVIDPPRPDPVSDGVTIMDKGTIVGDIEIDPS